MIWETSFITVHQMSYEADEKGRVVYQYLEYDPYCINLTIYKRLDQSFQ